MARYSALERDELLAEQARRARDECPQLFEFLHAHARDATLRRVVPRSPSPADAESCAGYDARRDFMTPLQRLEPGIVAFLAES